MKHSMQIKNLSFRFSQSAQPFFKEVNLTIEPKKIYFLQGANGSGKSTLFRLLQGTVHEGEVLTGTVIVDDVAYDLSCEASRKMLPELIHAVQQDYNSMIADQFNFEENLRFARLPRYPALKKLPTYSAMPALLKRFNIDVTKPVHLLSGGQRQILAMLMALQKPTTLLLLDEPTAALDSVNTEMVLTFLHELVALTDITILIISHDQNVLEKYANDQSFEMSIDVKTGERSIRPRSERQVQ